MIGVAALQHQHPHVHQRQPVTPAHPTSQLLLGDCLDLLTTLPDNSIDCIVTDPPYGIRYLSRSRALPLVRIANDNERAYATLDKALAIAYHKLKHNRHLYIFTNWQAYIPMAAIVAKYFTLKNVLIWEKNNQTRGDLAGNYGYQYEMILYAHKGRRELWGRRDSNILQFRKVPDYYMYHPTEKPVPLLEYLITKSTLPREMVLDMFMGSGSTCLAAKRTNRNYIGIEIESVFFEIAQARVAAEC